MQRAPGGLRSLTGPALESSYALSQATSIRTRPIESMGLGGLQTADPVPRRPRCYRSPARVHYSRSVFPPSGIHKHHSDLFSSSISRCILTTFDPNIRHSFKPGRLHNASPRKLAPVGRQRSIQRGADALRPFDQVPSPWLVDERPPRHCPPLPVLGTRRVARSLPFCPLVPSHHSPCKGETSLTLRPWLPVLRNRCNGDKLLTPPQLLGDATEQLSMKMGQTLGGLLNAS